MERYCSGDESAASAEIDDRDFGVSVEAELAEDAEAEDELCVFVSEVVKGGCAHRTGMNGFLFLIVVYQCQKCLLK